MSAIGVSSASAARAWSRIEATDRVLLRRPTAADAPGVFALHSDPAVYAFDPAETHPDLAHTERFLAPMLAHWEERGFGYWAVLVPGTVWPDGGPGPGPDDAGRVVAGLGGLQTYRPAYRDGVTELNVYYRFATATQGRGLARIVLDHVLAVAPLVAPDTDVVVRTRPGNAVARHVAERAGFVDEGLEPGTTDMQLLRYGAHRFAS